MRENIDRIMVGVKTTREETQRMSSSVGQINKHFDNILSNQTAQLAKFVPFGQVVFDKVKSISDVFQSATFDTKKVQGDLTQVEQFIAAHEAKRRATGLKREKDEQTAMIKGYQSTAEHLRARINSETKYNELKLTGSKMLTNSVKQLEVSLGLMILGVKYSNELNRSMLTVNASFERRHQLMREILSVQAKTGATTSEVAETTRVLVGLGLHTRSNFASNLEIVTKMQQALGVSADSAGDMARVYSQLNASVSATADGISRVVTSTGLAADAAARFSAEIGRALLSLGLTRGEYEKVQEIVLDLEGRVQRAGGTPGAITELVNRMTTLEGFAQVGTQLGVSSPDMLATQEGMKSAVNRLSEIAERQLAGTTGVGRLAAKEALSQQFGVSGANIEALIRARKSENDVIDQGLDLNKQWSNAMADSGQSMHRLIGSLQSLAVQAVLPAVTAFNTLMSGLANLVGAVTAIPVGVTVAISLIMGTIALVAIPRMLLALTMLSRAITLRASEMFAASALTRGSAVGGVGGVAVRLLGALASFPALVVGLLLMIPAVMYMARIMDKSSRDDLARRRQLEFKEGSGQKLLGFRAAIASGDIESAQRYSKQAIQDSIRSGELKSTSEQIKNIVSEAMGANLMKLDTTMGSSGFENRLKVTDADVNRVVEQNKLLYSMVEMMKESAKRDEKAEKWEKQRSREKDIDDMFYDDSTLFFWAKFAGLNPGGTR